MSDDLPPKENFSDWYNELLFQAEIMDVRYPAKGVYVWFPFGYDLRNHVYDRLKSLHDETGHDEVSFPVLIPEGILAKEGEHIAGFEDEVFWVTHGGRKELDERMALRPTSETPMYTMFDLWIRSHTDLPLKIYQVANIWRSETEHTRPLIRLREITGFKEAHTAHSSYDEAEEQVETALSLYEEFYDFLGVPHVVTERPEWDKFPGAEYTYAVDTLMPDGKALQIGTAHNLGQNFAEAFDVEFETPDGDHEYAYQTSYGVSERCIAAVMGVHGDDNGLVLPSEVAPTQVAVVPIPFGDEDENAEIMETCEKIVEDLEDAGVRAELDDSDESPGAKYYKWELKGTPLRAEVGPRDLESGSAKLVNRLGEEAEADFDTVAEGVSEELDSLSDEIRERAADDLDERIVECATYDEARDVAGDGFALVGWNGEEDAGKRIEDEVGVDMLGEPRGYSVEDTDIDECVETGDEAEKVVLLANTY
ncbi:MAG: proline--tRNA ligase [Halobacteriales archaeon]|nr:proline--tRNA ligase [Halobacteriales archaeon]